MKNSSNRSSKAYLIDSIKKLELNLENFIEFLLKNDSISQGGLSFELILRLFNNVDGTRNYEDLNIILTQLRISFEEFNLISNQLKSNNHEDSLISEREKIKADFSKHQAEFNATIIKLIKFGPKWPHFLWIWTTPKNSMIILFILI